MPRYVLLEFDDNQQAEAFVEKTIGKAMKGAPYRVRGFFAKPTKYCECGPLTDSQQKEQVTRGAKYGWLIHTKCRRPRPNGGQMPRNLLDPEDTPARMMDCFLHLRGEWNKGKGTIGDPRPNHPILVRDMPDDQTNRTR